MERGAGIRPPFYWTARAPLDLNKSSDRSNGARAQEPATGQIRRRRQLAGGSRRRNDNPVGEADRRGLLAPNDHTARSAALVEMAAGHRGSGRQLDEREIRRID